MQDPGRNEGCRARSLSAPSSVEPALIEQTRLDEFRCRLRDARERLARSGARMKEELDSLTHEHAPEPAMIALAAAALGQLDDREQRELDRKSVV